MRTVCPAIQPPTPRPSVALFLTLGLLALAACSPAFNWREVRPENTRLSLLLPCKPDKAQKIVPLGGAPTTLFMLGCDAGGATFAVALADLGDAAKAATVLAQWQSLTLANMKAAPASREALPLKLAGATPQAPPTLVKALGQRADGTAVSGQAAYFAQGSQVFQVVLYAANITPEVAETFFSSLKLE
jgi:hypothetical protein